MFRQFLTGLWYNWLPSKYSQCINLLDIKKQSYCFRMTRDTKYRERVILSLLQILYWMDYVIDS
jgi:hypothetical protein